MMATWPNSQPYHYTSVSRSTGIASATFILFSVDRYKAAANAAAILTVMEDAGDPLVLSYSNGGYVELSMDIENGTTEQKRPREMDKRVKDSFSGILTLPYYPWPSDYPYYDGSAGDEDRKLWRGELIDHWMRATGVLYINPGPGPGFLPERYASDIDAGAYKNLTSSSITSHVSHVGHSIDAGTGDIYVICGWYIFDKTKAFNTTNQKWVALIHCADNIGGLVNPGDEGRTFAIDYILDTAGMSDADLYNAVADGTLASGLTRSELLGVTILDLTAMLTAANAGDTSPALRFRCESEDPAATMSDAIDVSAIWLWTFFTHATIPAGYPT